MTTKMVAIAACIEELSFRGSPLRLLLYLMVVLGSTVVGAYGVFRYHKILVEAETFGEHATCDACGAYARFKVLTGSQVRCRKCNHEWRLIEPG